jgi:putative thioredoxin
MHEQSSDGSDWIIATTDESFDQDVMERSRQQPIVVDFWADWCQPCRHLTPILEKLAGEYRGKFLLVKANTEKNANAAMRFGVQGIPAVYGFRDGQLLDFFVGLLPEDQIKLWLDSLLPTEAEVLVARAREIADDDPAAATAKYREAMEADPNLANAKIGIAQILLNEGQMEECRELIAELERRGHLEPEAERIKAQLDVREKGQQVGSVAECRAAAEAAPEDMNVQLRLAEALAAAGQYKEALDTALNVVRTDRQQFGDSARQIMVDVFQLLPEDSELIGTYRRQLATALY